MTDIQYTLKKPKAAAQSTFANQSPGDISNPNETPGLIQGIPPNSIQEWRVAQALNKRDIDYIYQVEIDGGRNKRGGIVLDFLVYTPFAQPVPVHGDYWHQDELSEEEKLELKRLEEIYGREPIILWEHELTDQTHADQTIAEKLPL